ncbi:hypothetical protein ACFLEY_22540 [Bradyrhizobium sp. YCK136]|uniref:Uncharacterized protein n=1 Tax=Bradyrhizobium diazoefficiens TaxID=1355477 RepID=A0A0E4BWU0_9BRAD|nr:hypothetical protein NK6_8817 [Bradyrhizobium diazoefficiens]
MDRAGAAKPSEVLTYDPAEDFGFEINLAEGTMTFEGGFKANITEILDRYGDETEDPEEARYIIVEMPPDGLWVTIDLSQVGPQHVQAAPH